MNNGSNVKIGNILTKSPKFDVNPVFRLMTYASHLCNGTYRKDPWVLLIRRDIKLSMFLSPDYA